jgi:hypothetical protein
VGTASRNLKSKKIMAAEDTAEQLFNLGLLGEAGLWYKRPYDALRNKRIGNALVHQAVESEAEPEPIEAKLPDEQTFERLYWSGEAGHNSAA